MNQGLQEPIPALIEKMGGFPATIIFDLDGTLRHTCPSPTKTLLDQAVEFGARDSEDKRKRTTRWTHKYWAQSEEMLQDTKSYPDENEFWINYVTRTLLAFDCTPEYARNIAPVLHAYMQENFTPEDWVPEDVSPTLDILKQSGYQLGLLSNRQQPCHEDLDNLGLSEYFEVALVAGEVASWKPEPEIYYHMLDRLNAQPQNTLYIGDNYYADIVGARNARLHPVLLDMEDIFPDADCTVIHTIGELAQFASTPN